MPPAPESLAQVIRDHVERRAPLERDTALAGWDLALTGSDEAAARCERLETALKRLLSDRETFRKLEELRGQSIDDDGARREVERLWLDHAGNQVDPDLLARTVAIEVKAESVFAGFRPQLDGRELTENEVRKALADSDDVAYRQRVWEAAKEIGPELAPLVREMVRLRNEAARELGYRDYYAMQLALQEIDESFLFNVLGDLETLTQGPYDEWIGGLFAQLGRRFGCAPSEIRPWHLSDPFFQEAVPPTGVDAGKFYAGKDLVALTTRALAGMGFDITDMVKRSDLFPRAGKNQHAFCTHIDRMTDDIRVLCNVAADDYWMDTMLHEYGHAVYDQGLGRDLPWALREAAHTLSTEAIALLFGRFATNADWIVRVAGVPEADVRAMRDGLDAMKRAKQLLFPRWVMVMAHFERELYGNPDADLDTLWWDLVERFQKVPRPDGRSAPDWACKVHVALAPVYYHNYLLGDLMASQLDVALREELGTPHWFEDPRTAAFLHDRLFREGARRPWNDALEHATGSRLDPSHYVTQYVTAV